MKRKILIAILTAAALSTASVNPAWSQAAAAGGGSGTGHFPWWGYCLFGSAWGPIYATLRLNKELKKDEAYTAMSWCGGGSLWLVYNQKNKK